MSMCNLFPFPLLPNLFHHLNCVRDILILVLLLWVIFTRSEVYKTSCGGHVCLSVCLPATFRIKLTLSFRSKCFVLDLLKSL